jgi:hypothetical protein
MFRFIPYTLLATMLAMTTQSQAQTAPKIAIEGFIKPYFYLGVNNSFRVVAQQDSAVALGQVTARAWVSTGTKLDSFVPLEVGEYYGSFFVRPTQATSVEIAVDLGDTTVSKSIRVRPLPAQACLGKHVAYSDTKIGIGELKAQPGLTAPLVNLEVNGYCKIIRFDVLRASTEGPSSSSHNEGARFEPATRVLLQQAQSGDWYIFHHIQCRCSGNEQLQQLETLLVQVK